MKFKTVSDFEGLKIQLASPEEILSWSKGEVIKPETINYRTWRPEKDGLFCERIFGPSRDYECYCGKYKKIRFKGVVCDKCGVEVTTSKVRRERMGHIDLATPVVHLWYLKNSPSPISIILDIPQKKLEAVAYFSKYLVTSVEKNKRKEALMNLDKSLKEKADQIDRDSKDQIEDLNQLYGQERTNLVSKIKNKEQQAIAIDEAKVNLKQDIQKVKNRAESEKDKLESLINFLESIVKEIDILSVISDEEYFYLSEFKADIFFTVGMGAEAILDVLGKMDLKSTLKNLKKELKKTTSKIKKNKILQKVRIIKGMLESQTDPSWMILTKIPVIPPDLRPMVQLTGGRFATSDLNDLYRRLINRNNRLKKLIRLGAPEIILRNEKRMLQEAVDSLIDSQKASRKRRQQSKRVPRSLSDLLRGRKGRFRRNLLGKRVDYSGRSVIVVGPELKLNEVGLPREMAMEIFKPFILRQLITLGLAPNIRSAKNLIDKKAEEVYDILEKVTKNKYILLNRAPTLHKLSIQAFKPVLTDSLAIKLHPCVCAGFNADFDGDQMGVHLPLSKNSQREAKKLMLSSRNLLKPSDSSPVTVPSNEMAVGCYYITSVSSDDVKRESDKSLKDIPIFSSVDEMELAYQNKAIGLRQLVAVRMPKTGIIKTSYGRILFNRILPDCFDFINSPISGKELRSIIVQSLKDAGRTRTVVLIDSLKEIGFYGFTLSGLTLSTVDCGLLQGKGKLIAEAEKKVAGINNNFKMGLITAMEKDRLSQGIWMEVTEAIAEKTWETLDNDSPIKIVSGAGIKRASKDQIKQLSGMRGLMVDPMGRIVALPTKSNFREGLSVFEYVTGARGTRKGLADTALKTADAGYLTRRLADATHSSIIREHDCGTSDFLTISKKDKDRERYFAKRILGRFLVNDVVDPVTKKLIAKKDQIIDDSLVEVIEASSIESVDVRSPLYCQSLNGICQKCYGWDLSNRKIVDIGTPVGIIAAQSVGEPGTQLTLRTKHTGGVVGVDVTQGLPRVQELLEIRTPKLPSPLAEISGKVYVSETDEGYKIKLVGKDEANQEKIINYLLPSNIVLKVENGDLVSKGTPLCSGSLDVEEILAIRGLDAARRYLLDNVQFVYESQGISVHDKHFEIIIKEMSDKIKITNPGDTGFLYGQYVTRAVFKSENDKVKAENGRLAKGKKVLLGLIKSALTTDSWLSSASFQQTTNVLTESSILGQVDHLIGLKENVIIGRLIPVGDPLKLIK